MSRSEKLGTRTLRLTAQDPLDRLAELKKIGMYNYNFSWDQYTNGVMCTCTLFYTISNHRRIVATVSRFVEDKSLEYAQKQVAAILLDSIGLGIPVVESDDEEEKEMKLKMNNMTEKLGVLCSEALRSLPLSGPTPRWGDT